VALLGSGVVPIAELETDLVLFDQFMAADS
jgi:hypothetical protein